MNIRGSLAPCNNDVGCLSLSKLVVGPKEFCESAFQSFTKAEMAHESDEPDLCFDGVPASVRKTGKTVLSFLRNIPQSENVILTISLSKKHLKKEIFANKKRLPAQRRQGRSICTKT